jgi:hypothetical protein
MTPTPRCPPCPKCRHAAGTRLTVKSDYGWYCLCDNCGNIWHNETMVRESPSWLDAAVVAEKPEER